MAKLVRGHMEVQTIHMVRGAFPMASENGAGRITDVFPIHILVVDFLSCGVVLNMVPQKGGHPYDLKSQRQIWKIVLPLAGTPPNTLEWEYPFGMPEFLIR